MSEEVLIASLERIAEKAGDPSPLVYERLFREQPEMEELFIMDTDGAARGNMFQQFIESILDLQGEGYFAKGLLQTEVLNHNGIGVPPDVFRTFFAVTLATFRDIMGDEWTGEVAAAWDGLEARFDKVLAA